MDLELDGYLSHLSKTVEPSLKFQAQSVDEWSRWREKLLSEFSRCLGEFPESGPSPDPELLEVQEEADHLREKISIRTLPGLRASAYVLVPKLEARRFPVVLALHGHGEGNEPVAGLSQDYHRSFGLDLVRRGFLVVVPQLAAFGERRFAEFRSRPREEWACYRLSTNLLMYGLTTAGLRVYEARRFLDYCGIRPDADTGRMACMGISGGGLVSVFTAALDQRIRAAVVSGYANTFRDSIMSIDHCIDNFLPGILRYAELPDLFCLVAPRPLLLESGTRDPIFPIDAARFAYSRLKEAYRLLDSESVLEADFFEGDHRISGARAYSWLEEHL